MKHPFLICFLALLPLVARASAKVSCFNGDDSEYLTDEIIAVGRPGFEGDHGGKADGYFRTLAIVDGRLQTVRDTYQPKPYDNPSDYKGNGIQVSFHSCSSAYTAKGNGSYTFGKLAIQPTKKYNHISSHDKCLTFHPKHKQFGAANCSFVDDESQGAQTFATEYFYTYRFVGSPTNISRFSFDSGAPSWKVYPRQNTKNKEWTIDAKFEKEVDSDNGFIGNFPYEG